MNDLAFTSVLSSGTGRSRLYSAAQRGEMVPLAPGAYIPLPQWSALPPAERYRRAVFAVGHSHTLTGRSVMALRGLPLWPVPHEIDISHRGRGHRGLGSALPHGMRLRIHQWDGPLAPIEGVLCVPAERSFLTAVTRLPFESGVVLADEYMRQQLSSLGTWDEHDVDRLRAALLRALADSGLRRGRGVARSVLEFADPRNESVGESRSRVLFHEAGLTAPELQRQFCLDTGELVRGDFYWKGTGPGAGVIGEFDGRVKYGKLLRPGETAQMAVVRERRREKLLQQMGFTVVRWEWADLEHPDRIIAWLARAGVQ